MSEIVSARDPAATLSKIESATSYCVGCTRTCALLLLLRALRAPRTIAAHTAVLPTDMPAIAPADIAGGSGEGGGEGSGGGEGGDGEGGGGERGGGEGGSGHDEIHSQDP